MDNGKTLPIEDAGSVYYIDFIAEFFAIITNDKKWNDAVNLIINHSKSATSEFYFIISHNREASEFVHDEHFEVFPETGYVSFKKGTTRFFGLSGASCGHANADEGSFTIEKDGDFLLIDRGYVITNQPCCNNINCRKCTICLFHIFTMGFQ